MRPQSRRWGINQIRVKLSISWLTLQSSYTLYNHSPNSTDLFHLIRALLEELAAQILNKDACLKREIWIIYTGFHLCQIYPGWYGNPLFPFLCAIFVRLQELKEGLASHQPVMAILTRTGEQIIGQLSSPDGSLLEEKLDVLAQRWRGVNREVLERQRRYYILKNTLMWTESDPDAYTLIL